jgi:hypothetical protein
MATPQMPVRGRPWLVSAPGVNRSGDAAAMAGRLRGGSQASAEGLLVDTGVTSVLDYVRWS